MKRKFSLLLIAFAPLLNINSQVLSEDFTSPFAINSTNGWSMQNNSSPTGTVSWFQGNAISTFSAYNGGVNDYFAANYNSTGATSTGGTISNWLISPTVSLVNGARIQFATRTTATNTVFPDRLQLYTSAAASNTLPSGASSLGTFTGLIFDVNSSLSTATVATQSGSTTTGYPQAWTVYSGVVTGITGTVTGRFAFRYFVTGAGAVGANGNYIGIDAVKYFMPCDTPAFSVAQTPTAGVCSGNTVSLSATPSGTVSISSYQWSSGATTATAIVSPSTTTVYSVTALTSAGCSSTRTVAVSASVTPVLQVSSYTICPSNSATLNATGTSTAYAWSTSTAATTSSIVVSPTATTVYTVTGIGSATNCPAIKTVTVTLGSQLSVDLAASSTAICAGQVVTVNLVTAASTYSWSNGGSGATFTAIPSANTTYSVGAILGTGTAICTGTNAISISVLPVPTLALTQVNALCSGATFTASASGANSYVYLFSGFSSTANPLSVVVNSVNLTSTISYSVVGTSTNGCSASVPNSFTINASPIIAAAATKTANCINTTATVVATGANSYTWSGAASGNNATVTAAAGPTATALVFTIAGTSTTTGCSGITTVSVQISDCLGLDKTQSAGLLNVFPNPFSDVLKFSGFDGRVEVYNLLGEIVIQSTVNSQGQENVNTSALPKGIYVVKAFNDGGREFRSVKLIKN